MLFWKKLNISEAALKEFKIFPVSKWHDGYKWIFPQETSPIFVAEYTNSITFIEPYSEKDNFSVFNSSVSDSIFGFENLPSEANTLFVVKNIIDVLFLDSLQLSSIFMNLNNVERNIQVFEILKYRFNDIYIVDNELFQNNNIVKTYSNYNIKKLEFEGKAISDSLYKLFLSGCNIENLKLLFIKTNHITNTSSLKFSIAS